MKGRPKRLTPQQEREILELRQREGFGTPRLAKIFRVSRSLVVRLLAGKQSRTALPGSPAACAEIPRETKALPGPAVGKCRGCGEQAVLRPAELCNRCFLDLATTFGASPVARGHCWRCAQHAVPLAIITRNTEHFEGICLQCWYYERASIAAEGARERLERRIQQQPDSRGLVPREDGLGWRVG